MRLVFQNWEEAWREVGKSGKPVMILLNHVSFLDAMLFCAFVPTWTLWGNRPRTLCSVGIMRIPVLGQIIGTCGHIPVVFSSVKTGIDTGSDFAIKSSDASKMMNRVNEHLHSHGWLAMCPEGKLNPGSERQLQSFRFGGFKTVEEFDMEVWGWGLTGCGDFWPAGGVGGKPATITINVFPIFPNGAQAHLKASEEKEKRSEEEKKTENFKILAQDAQNMFQEKLDSVWADLDKANPSDKCKSQ